MATTIETTQTTTKNTKVPAPAETANTAALKESQRRYYTPAADIFEGEAGWMVLVDLPGVTKKGVDIQFDKDVLTVRADRDDTRGYMRSFGIPKDVDVKKIAAKQADGVLTLTLPKVPAAKPLSIKVK